MRFVALCAALLSTLAAGPGHAADAPRGSLVIAGGALRFDNAEVWQRMVSLAGGQGAEIAVIPAASGNPLGTGNRVAEVLRRYGAKAFVVPLSPRLPDTDYRTLAQDQAMAERIRKAGGVFFTGGDQGKITQVLLQADGAQTPLLQAIWAMYQRGGVIGGTSAGAAIMSTTMFREGQSSLLTLQNGVREGHELDRGLGFIGPEVFVDQHFLARGRFARMLAAMMKAKYTLGFGIDENTAMVVRGGREIEILGYRGALLIDLRQATTDPALKAFNAGNVRISYLDRGDRYDFISRTFTPSREKENGLIKAVEPDQEVARIYPDMFANMVVVDAMQSLIDSRKASLKGLGFGVRNGDAANLGFEFTLSKVAESRGYYSNANGEEAYSVLDLRLDVAPVEIARSLYQPLAR